MAMLTACCCNRSGEMKNVVDATAAADFCYQHAVHGTLASAFLLSIIRGQTSPEGFDPPRTTSCPRPSVLRP